jgi:hypothetical protein
MADISAIRAAIELINTPHIAPVLRRQTLPGGTVVLLKILAGDEQILSEIVHRTDRLPSRLRDASIFYVEQILFSHDADAYRILGTNADAAQETLRENMALLLRWLHPDKAVTDRKVRHVTRVTSAWNQLKTIERRAAYDSLRNARAASHESYSRSKDSKGSNKKNQPGNPKALRSRPRVYRSGLIGFIVRFFSSSALPG